MSRVDKLVLFLLVANLMTWSAVIARKADWPRVQTPSAYWISLP